MAKEKDRETRGPLVEQGEIVEARIGSRGSPRSIIKARLANSGNGRNAIAVVTAEPNIYCRAARRGDARRDDGGQVPGKQFPAES
jgi:hypothetical protein